MRFLLTWVVTAVAAAAACMLVPGMEVEGGYMGIFVFALAIALVNASIRPIMQVVSLPITVLTLGIFYFVVNALALNVASWLSLNEETKISVNEDAIKEWAQGTLSDEFDTTSEQLGVLSLTINRPTSTFDPLTMRPQAFEDPR